MLFQHWQSRLVKSVFSSPSSSSFRCTTLPSLCIPTSFSCLPLLNIPLFSLEKHFSACHVSIAHSHGDEEAIAVGGTSCVCWPERCPLGRSTFTRTSTVRERNPRLTGLYRVFAALHLYLLSRGRFLSNSDVPLQQDLSFQTYVDIRPIVFFGQY